MKKKKWVPKSKQEKAKPNSKLEDQVAKFNPEFVKWLKTRKTKARVDNDNGKG